MHSVLFCMRMVHPSPSYLYILSVVLVSFLVSWDDLVKLKNPASCEINSPLASVALCLYVCKEQLQQYELWKQYNNFIIII